MPTLQHLSSRYSIVLISIIAFISSCALRQSKLNMAMNSIQMTSQVHKSQAKNDSAKFMRAFHNLSSDLPFRQQLLGLYERNGYQTVFLNRFLENGQIQSFITYLDHIDQHGLNNNLFPSEKIKKLLQKKEGINSMAESNANDLELLIASSLIKYSIILQFGATSPSTIYENYSTPTLIPDSNVMIEISNIANLKKYLDSIQPKDKNYLTLQKTLALIETDRSAQKEDNKRKLVVNLERLRWKNKPILQKFVAVNIANFTLDVIDKGKSILNMKVCVGEPGEWATPQLGSMIYTVQVNPVWNIPQSIIKQETVSLISENRYYLAKNNINVYQNGKLVQEPELINWLTVDPDKYQFQQQPGSKNALGKIKFLFANESNVYLHDTPDKAVFKNGMRAVSHGCVRVEKPLELAYTLFGKSEKFKQIKNAMQNGTPSAKYITLSPPIPVRLLYYTALGDGTSGVKFYDDVYGLDQALYIALQRVFN
ncbi:MAG: L,D-transpeptidase family protein [Bacteroidota bacterium]